FPGARGERRALPPPGPAGDGLLLCGGLRYAEPAVPGGGDLRVRGPGRPHNGGRLERRHELVRHAELAGPQLRALHRTEGAQLLRWVGPQVRRSTWGETRLCWRGAWLFIATARWRSRIRANPDRVMAAPWALRKTSGVGASPRTASQARRESATSFQSVSVRSLRPFPRMYRWRYQPSNRTAASGMPTSSETRSPPARARCSIARSRMPRRLAGSGTSRIARYSCLSNERTIACVVRWVGIASTRRIWSRRAGTRCSRNRMKDLIA